MFEVIRFILIHLMSTDQIQGGGGRHTFAKMHLKVIKRGYQRRIWLACVLNENKAVKFPDEVKW